MGGKSEVQPPADRRESNPSRSWSSSGPKGLGPALWTNSGGLQYPPLFVEASRQSCRLDPASDPEVARVAAFLDADVIVIKGGLAGSTLGTLLARSGHRALMEADRHEHIWW
jgi:hypothetical protein